MNCRWFFVWRPYQTHQKTIFILGRTKLMYNEAFPNFIKIGELCFLVTLNGFDWHALKSIRFVRKEVSLNTCWIARYRKKYFNFISELFHDKFYFTCENLHGKYFSVLKPSTFVSRKLTNKTDVSKWSYVRLIIKLLIFL